MKKLSKVLIIVLLVMVSLIGEIGCTSVNKSESEFNLEQFENEIKLKGYEYKRQDLQEGLLTPISQYMHLNNSVTIDEKKIILYDTDIVIYSYNANEEMEKEANTISKDASEINRGDNLIQVKWPKAPHFYKKGTIIVQYIGEDKQILSSLKEIMGEQFVGIK